jgi:aryl-alcohol dehydrogenase-like predicted oxidoreductase
MIGQTARRVLGKNFEICPLIHGLWQTSGGHGKVTEENTLKYMADLANEGFTTFDGADHYGPAEILMGLATKSLAKSNKTIETFTKWVPSPGPMTRSVVEKAIGVSLKRMDSTCIDLLQFHWWVYEDNEYLNAMKHLKDLQTEGKIKLLGLTNFDTEHMKKIVESGVEIVSNQVSYSVIDTRPMKHMTAFCQQHNIKLLAYGSVLGGFLSDKFLGVKEKDIKSDTWSLSKYYRFIKQWSGGNWELFQELLRAMRTVADKHSVSIANVAMRYVLDQPCVGGVIVGIRPGLSDHIQDNKKTLQFTLDDADREAIESVVKKGNSLLGDCGDEYRQ